MLSAIEAIREGRALFPNYVSGNLVTVVDSTGTAISWSKYDKSWYKYDADDNRVDIEGKPSCGSSCLLGAQGLGMGLPLSELGIGDGYFAHPDFFVNPEDREKYPSGFTFTDGGELVELARADSPCRCDSRDISEASTPSIPTVIAHLNDAHDPRYESAKKDDPFTEADVVGWLQGLGYR